MAPEWSRCRWDWITYRGGVHVHPLQLADDEVVLGHHRVVGVHHRVPVTAGVLGNLEGVSAVVKHAAPGVRDQEERNRDLVRVPESLVHLDELDLGLEAAALEKVEAQIVHVFSLRSNAFSYRLSAVSFSATTLPRCGCTAPGRWLLLLDRGPRFSSTS